MELFLRNDCPLKDMEADFDAHLTDQDYRANAMSEKIILLESGSYQYKKTFGINHTVIRIR